MEKLKRPISRRQEEEGLGTLEIVIIIAVLLAIAVIFREKIMAFTQQLMEKVFDSSLIDGF